MGTLEPQLDGLGCTITLPVSHAQVLSLLAPTPKPTSPLCLPHIKICLEKPLHQPHYNEHDYKERIMKFRHSSYTGATNAWPMVPPPTSLIPLTPLHLLIECTHKHTSMGKYIPACMGMETQFNGPACSHPLPSFLLAHAPSCSAGRHGQGLRCTTQHGHCHGHAPMLHQLRLPTGTLACLACTCRRHVNAQQNLLSKTLPLNESALFPQLRPSSTILDLFHGTPLSALNTAPQGLWFPFSITSVQQPAA